MAHTEETKIKLEDHYQPSEFELDIIQEIYKKFFEWRNEHYLPRKQFRGSSLLEYLDESRNLFFMNTSTIDDEELKKFDIDIGDARRASLETISTLTSLKIKPKPVPNLTNSIIYWQKVIDAIYQKWRVNSVDKVEKFWQLLYGVINGTIAVYVGFNNRKRKLKNIEGYNPKTGEFSISEFEKIDNEVITNIIPLEDLFFPKVWERNIQKQGEVIIRSVLKLSEFKKAYANYENVQYVYLGSNLSEDSIFYKLVSESSALFKDQVVVLSYYDSIDDRFIIIANGVWINPIVVNRKKSVAPLPFNHKEIPIAFTQFEPIDNNFAYGLSLPFKLKDPARFLNSFFSLMLEREAKEVSPPILSQDIEKVNIKFGSGEIIPVSNINDYRELTISPASPAFFNTINYLSSVVNAHIGRTLLPEGGSRQPKTATERRIQEQLRFQILSNIVLMYWYLIYQEYKLVVKTALQYYTYESLSKKTDKRIIKNIILEDAPLVRGGLGRLLVRIVNKTNPPEEIFKEEQELSRESKRQTEIIEANISALSDIDFIIDDITLEQEETNELKQALFIEKASFMMNNPYFAQIIDPFKAFARYLEVIGETPSDWARDDLVNEIVSRIRNIKITPQIQNQKEGGNIAGLPTMGQVGNNLNDIISQIRGQLLGSQGGLTTAGTEEMGQEPQVM